MFVLLSSLNTLLADVHYNPLNRLERNGRPLEVLARIRKVPDERNGRKASKNHRRAVHRLGIDGNGNWHAEDDDREADPHDADAVHGCAELPQGVRRVLDGAAALDKVDEDRHAVGRREADGGDAGERRKGGRRPKVHVAEDAVDSGRQKQRIQRHLVTRADLGPHLAPGNGAVAGKGVRAGHERGEESARREQEVFPGQQ
jgi:hypothetical protein